jgi:predicted aminopeptidase
VDTGLIRAAAAVALSALLSGCYYGHLMRGQLQLLAAREPIAELLADPGLDPALRQRLERALAARRFASRELGLPDNASYTTYADLDRPYAVWNVFATPDLSLQPRQWCHLFVGCMAYQGYYDRERADATAAELREEGLDVFVAGIPTYSTLGWFDDPLLSTMRGGEDEIAGAIFHELAHQVTFAPGDTAFNESFATFVEQEGLRRYLKDLPEVAREADRRQRWQAGYRRLMFAARARLVEIYRSDAPAADKQQRKRAVFQRLRKDYVKLRRAWRADWSEDTWLIEPNNAQLLPFGLYHAWVPAFAVLLQKHEGNWQAFYAEAAELADLDERERHRRLEALSPQLSPPDPLPEEEEEEQEEEQPEPAETAGQ